jgi:hypothetical protein
MKTFRQSSKWLILFLLFALLLSGCITIIKASFEMKIGMQEKWDFVATLVVPPGAADLLVTGLNQQYAKAVSPASGYTVNIQKLDPDQQGNIPVKVSISGQGYDRLNQAMGAQVITVEDAGGSRTLAFRWSLGSSLMVHSTEFTLSGGKILTSNGTAVNNTTVKWIDYSGTMTATMQEPSWMDYLPWFILGCGAVVLVLGGLVVVIVLKVTRKKPAPQRAYAQPRPVYPQQPPAANYPPPAPQFYPPPSSAPQPAASQIKFCLQCGGQIPGHSTFCPLCGAKQS